MFMLIRTRLLVRSWFDVFLSMRVDLVSCPPRRAAASAAEGFWGHSEADVTSPHLNGRSARCPRRWHRCPDLNLPSVNQGLQRQRESAPDAQPSSLLPSPLSHRSARCIGICRPNHCFDTGQSHAHAWAHTRGWGPRIYAQNYFISFKAPTKYISFPITLTTNKTGLCAH